MRIYPGEQQEGITPSKSRFFLGHFLHRLRITLGTLNLVRVRGCMLKTKRVQYYWGKF